MGDSLGASKNIVEFGSPRPSVGEGLGGEGDADLLDQLPKPGSETLREHSAAFAPSPLTPLPRWGEGDRTVLPKSFMLPFKRRI